MKNFKNNPIKFIENFNYGYDTKAGVIQDRKLYDFQKEIINNLETHTFNLILKSRQMFMSSLLSSYALWNLLYKENYNICFVGVRQQSFTYFKNKMIQSYSKKLNIKHNNKKVLELENGNKIFNITSKKDHFQDSINLIILDEFDFNKNQSELFYHVNQTLAKNFKIIFSSTPNYENSFFHKIYINSLLNKNAVHITNLHWDKNPVFNNITWYEKQCALLKDSELIDSELNLIFRKEKKKKEKKEEILSFRIETVLVEKLNNKLSITRKTLSNHIRNLIEQDLEK